MIDTALNRDFTNPDLPPLEQANLAFKVALSDLNDAISSVFLAASAVDYFFRKGPSLNANEREAIKAHLRAADAGLFHAKRELLEFEGTGDAD